MVFEQEKTEETENDMTSVLSVSSCSTLLAVARVQNLVENARFLPVVVRKARNPENESCIPSSAMFEHLSPETSFRVFPYVP
jgi:hypothetical protein